MLVVPVDLIEKAQQASEGQAGALEVGWNPCAGVGLCDVRGSMGKLNPCAGVGLCGQGWCCEVWVGLCVCSWVL